MIEVAIAALSTAGVLGLVLVLVGAMLDSDRVARIGVVLALVTLAILLAGTLVSCMVGLWAWALGALA